MIVHRGGGMVLLKMIRSCLCYYYWKWCTIGLRSQRPVALVGLSVCGLWEHCWLGIHHSKPSNAIKPMTSTSTSIVSREVIDLFRRVVIFWQEQVRVRPFGQFGCGRVQSMVWHAMWWIGWEGSKPNQIILFNVSDLQSIHKKDLTHSCPAYNK